MKVRIDYVHTTLITFRISYSRNTHLHDYVVIPPVATISEIDKIVVFKWLALNGGLAGLTRDH